MKSHTLLRIASVLTLLLCLGHTLGAPWTPTGSPEALALVETTRTLHFDVMGTSRSLLDFYRGFGYSLSICLFAQAILL